MAKQTATAKPPQPKPTTTKPTTTPTTTDPNNTPKLTKPIRPTFVANWKLHIHVICFLITLGYYLHTLQFAIACIGDHPDARLIFATIFRSQQDNQAINYGRLTIALIILSLYPHCYLVSEYHFLTWDLEIYRRRRRLITQFYWFMSLMLVVLPCGVMYQLSKVMAFEDIITTLPFQHLYAAALRTAIVFASSAIFMLAFPIDAPLYQRINPATGAETTVTATTTTTTTTTTVPTPAPKQTRQERMRQQRAQIEPLNPDNHLKVFEELAQRFPDQEDIYDPALVKSRFDQHSSSDDDEDNEDEDWEEDEDESDFGPDDHVDDVSGKLDKMIHEMADILGKAARDEKRKKEKQD